jgi:hypothetical protein
MKASEIEAIFYSESNPKVGKNIINVELGAIVATTKV